MKRILLSAATLIVCLPAGPGLSAGESGDEQEYVVKVYRVSDLVVTAQDYPFRGVFLPGIASPSLLGSTGGILGGSGFSSSGTELGTELGDPKTGGIGTLPFAPHRGAPSGVRGNETAAGMAPGAAGGALGGFGYSAPAGVPRRTTTMPAASAAITMDDLIQVITAVVAPESWAAVGGPGNIEPLAGMLVVSQQPAVHKKIDELLNAIRQQHQESQSVVIRAWWILGTGSKLTELLDSPGRQPMIVDEAVLKMKNAVVARGQVACFNGQTVHIVSGCIRSSLTSLIPVVGRIDRTEKLRQLARNRHPSPNVDRLSQDSQGKPAGGRPSRGPDAKQPHSPATRISKHVLAQVAGMGGLGGGSGPWSAALSGGNSKVGYQPVQTTVNYGVLLQVTPFVVPESSSVILDVRSVVTQQNPPVAPQVQRTLDSINVVAQQFLTTLRAPLDKCVVIGGSTLQPNIPEDSDTEQLYLLVKVTVPAKKTGDR